MTYSAGPFAKVNRPFATMARFSGFGAIVCVRIRTGGVACPCLSNPSMQNIHRMPPGTTQTLQKRVAHLHRCAVANWISIQLTGSVWPFEVDGSISRGVLVC